MTRGELEHVIRAAGAIADVRELVVIGSQAVLGAHPTAPPELLGSMEADVFVEGSPELSETIDGAIGEGSTFHRTFGYHAHGVGEETATLPAGWRDRLVPVAVGEPPAVVGRCLEPHDLAIRTLVAGRPHDLAFVAGLLRHRLVDRRTLAARLDATELPPDLAEPVRGRLARLLAAEPA